ncbi:M28 family peptidase [Spirosoma flavum]|uniref:M28 family peptidase n=1 Tax=Spirosoma flavum TaxID=2048557 RepID=A0ABW6ALG1_9BACT
MKKVYPHCRWLQFSIRHWLFILVVFNTLPVRGLLAQGIPLLPDSLIGMFDAELSGESAKRNLEYISRLHRMRGSVEYKKAVEFITTQLRDYGLQRIETIQIPADGKTMYGTQKSRLAWEADFAELWEMQKKGSAWMPGHRIADWESMPITLAEDSESGDVTAELVDIGAGSSESDYAGKNIAGKLVLTSSPPTAVVVLAIEKYKAAGIISSTQNQHTAWWQEDENLIRWGHLNSFSPLKIFCFMVSLKQARSFQQRLSRGETIRLHAQVKAGKHPGFYEFVTAVIEGSDSKLKEQEIAFTCHLDHQRPGANDNASGSVTILEIARALNKLIQDGKMARPKRTLRFIWSPEIEGTSALLSQRPAYASRIKAVIHMDMVGGAPITKAVFHVSRTPQSLPSFVGDVGEAVGAYLNQETRAFASGEPATHPFVAQEGGKEALLAVLGEFSLGSDHEVYSEGSFSIPSIYLHDWPDRYIHTNFDLPAHIDPTKLKRAGFVGAASGYMLANLTDNQAPVLWNLVKQQSVGRTAKMLQRLAFLSQEDAAVTQAFHWSHERGVFTSLSNFITIPTPLKKEADIFYESLGKTINTPLAMPVAGTTANVIYRRNERVKGPMSVFSYDYFVDHYGSDKAKNIRLPDFQGRWGPGSEYAYEVLNFVDGHRTVTDIRNAVSAELGPVPTELVSEYLQALASINVITPLK